jgi:hypothetical protein
MGPNEEEFQKLNSGFKVLTDHWQTFVEAVGLRVDPQQPNAAHPDPPSTIPVESRYVFPLFGKRAFVRFDHDLTDGFISYGIVETGEYTNQEREAARIVFAFDGLGKLYSLENGKRSTGSEVALHLADDVRELHFRSLLQLCDGVPFSTPKVECAANAISSPPSPRQNCER